MQRSKCFMGLSTIDIVGSKGGICECALLRILLSASRPQPHHSTGSRVQPVITAIGKLKVQLGLMATLTNPLILLLIFPFFSVQQHDSDSAHRFHSPSHSQRLVGPKPSCPSSFSAEWMTRRCSERQWTTECGGASSKILQVLFFKARLCKSPSTPSLTPLLPCVLTPLLTNSHSGSLSCSRFHASPPL